jgi:transcriptional regulator with XRE-family HTH domain
MFTDRPDTVQRPALGQTDAVFRALGDRLRNRRKELKLTLRDVAENAGLSVGFISQIERGLTMPSLSSLVSVSRVLGVHVDNFLAQPKVISDTTRQTEREHYKIGTSPVSYERLSSSFPGNAMRAVLIHEPPGHRTEPIAHEGEELFFIVGGALTVELDGIQSVLLSGDSIHFSSTRRHSTWNHTDQPVTLLVTCTMDIFGDDLTAPSGANSLIVRHNTGAKTRRKPRKNPSTDGDGQ